MIRKNTPVNWPMINTIIILVLAMAFVVYANRPTPKDQYWFVSYEWVKIKEKERGAGRICVAVKEGDFDIIDTENTIKNANKFDSLIINNFIPISRATHALCVKKL
ncbi:MAG: hypothetical protein OEL83_03930 [Desulforhopalus sp.]|nr:hypothetical protein [Desulforhopalus sp.]